MSIKIRANFDKELKNFSDLKRHIRGNVEFGLEKALAKSIKDLQAELKYLINEGIKINSEAQNAGEEVPPELNVPKSKNELLKYIFEEDISKADYLRKSVGNKTINDNSNVFVVKDKRIKIWQSVDDSSTYLGQENSVRNRLIKGILINGDDGKMRKLNPKSVKGVKLECSKDTGQTIDSDKKFEAYKSSNKVTRTKEGPYDRTAVWTVKQEDVQQMLGNSVDLDALFDKINDGDFDTALNMIKEINLGGELNSAEQKVTNLKLRQDLTPNVAVYQDILTLIKNLKVEKVRSEKSTRFTLYSNYGDQAENSELFFDQMRKQIYMWILSNQDFWYNSMVEQVIIALGKYDSKAKFT
jgi:hypothetical protein